MIGWKILCEFESGESVAEICSYPFDTGIGFMIMVYHDGHLKPIHYNEIPAIKVIERSKQ